METLQRYLVLKGKFSLKYKFCHHLLALMLFQTCTCFFLLLKKEDRLFRIMLVN